MPNKLLLEIETRRQRQGTYRAAVRDYLLFRCYVLRALVSLVRRNWYTLLGEANTRLEFRDELKRGHTPEQIFLMTCRTDPPIRRGTPEYDGTRELVEEYARVAGVGWTQTLQEIGRA